MLHASDVGSTTKLLTGFERSYAADTRDSSGGSRSTDQQCRKPFRDIPRPHGMARCSLQAARQACHLNADIIQASFPGAGRTAHRGCGLRTAEGLISGLVPANKQGSSSIAAPIRYAPRRVRSDGRRPLFMHNRWKRPSREGAPTNDTAAELLPWSQSGTEE